MTDPQRLRDLPADRFGVLVAEVLKAAWSEWNVETAPASPDGTVEAVVTRDGQRRLIHVQQAPAESAITEGAIRDLATLSDDGKLQGATFVTTGTFSAAAREAAEDRDVELINGEGFAEMARRADVAVTVDDDPSIPDLIEQFAAHWPRDLKERTIELAEYVAGSAPFTRTVRRTEDVVDVEFSPQDSERPVVKLRLLEESVLVYVRRDDAFDSVLRLTAHREEQPHTDELINAVETALETALGDS